MARRRWRDRNSDAEPNTRLGIQEKQKMRDRVDNLLARPMGLFLCPLPYERVAEIWNTTQPQHLVEAIKVLDADKLSEGNCGNLKTAEIAFDFRKIGVTFHVTPRTTENYNGWMNDSESPIYMIDEKQKMTWDQFSNLMTREECAALVQWFEDCRDINTSVKESRETFSQVVDIVNTAGQLNRLVPECVLFMSPDKQAKLQEQAKQSAMPEAYFELNHDAMRRMNDFLTKCRLMPEQKWGLEIYDGLTWAQSIKE